MLSILSGVGIGSVFPFFSMFFTTYKKPIYAVYFFVLCLVAGALVGGINFFIGKLTLIHAIRKFTQTFDRAIQGDLTARCEMTGEDEFGQLSHDFNTFMGQIELMVASLKGHTLRINRMATELTAIVDEHQIISEEISQATATIAKDASTQMDQLDHIKSRIFDTKNVMKDGLDKALVMLEISSETSLVAKDGGGQLTDVVANFKITKDNFEATTASLLALEEKSQKIGKVVNVIGGIADQTNMLALNAAIEAARAGEAGKGFAVVAEEVRSLSVSTAEASRIIAQEIKETQEDMKRTLLYMEENLSLANSHLKMITEGEMTFSDVVVKSHDVHSNAGEVHTIYHNLHQDADQINLHVGQVSALSMGNASCSEQVATAAARQRKGVQVISDNTHQLTALSKQLNEDIAFFVTAGL